MTATNHALTGAVLALVVKEPAAVIPIAIASHFVLDSLPHLGGIPTNTRRFLFILAADAGTACAILLTLIVLLPSAWLIPVFGAVLAMAPDLMWFPNFIREATGRKLKKTDGITKWHKAIQRYERPWGIAFELVWFAVLIPVLFRLMVNA